MKCRKGKVFFKDVYAGLLIEKDSGFSFQYDVAYLNVPGNQPISLIMPLRKEPYTSYTMLPAFDGLIPEGWLLDIAENNWKIEKRDRMGLLLKFCGDCIGAISVIEYSEQPENE